MSSTETTMSDGAYVTANGIDIYYQESGQGVSLILIHGGTVTHTMWDQHIPTFAKYFRVIAPDSRGHGRTKNTASSITYRMMADDTAEFIRALGLDKPLVCGYSDGGQIGLELAMNYPALAGAYLIGGATIEWAETYADFLREFGMEGPGNVNFEYLERDRPKRVERLRAAHDTFLGPDYWKTHMVQMSSLWWTPLNYVAEDLKKIQEPTLVMIWDRDDMTLPVDRAAEVYRMIPNAELAVVPGADHFFVWERPEVFTQVALDFLLRQRQRVQPNA